MQMPYIHLLAHYRKQFDELRKSTVDDDAYKMIVDLSRQEIKMDVLRVERPDCVVEMRNVETETPEELAWLKELVQPAAAAQAPLPRSPFNVPTKPISEYLETFLKTTAINSSDRYVDAIRDAVDNFIEFFGDNPPENITAEHVQQFAESFATWPANRRKRRAYRDKTLFEILAEPVPVGDRITVATYNNNLQKLSSFMIWLREQQVLNIENPCKRLFKKEKNARDQWSDFSLTEVQQILSKENLTFDAERPSRYWIPMILAHSGARIEEICALYREDVERDPGTGIWCIKIQNDKADKHIKNAHSCRDVPIHSFLESIGFLDYVASIPAGTRLFPDLTYKEKFGYHDKISDYFSRYLKRINVYQPKKTLKSFRHSVITALYQNGVSREIVPEVVGHSPDSASMSLSRYHKGFLLLQTKEALEKIGWNLV
jgi:integrase